MNGKGVNAAGAEQVAMIGLMVCAGFAASGVYMAGLRLTGRLETPLTRFMDKEHGIAASVVSI